MNVEPEALGYFRQHGRRLAVVDGAYARLLVEFFVVGIHDHRHMQTAQHGQPEQLLRIDLVRRRVEQVDTTYDVRDVLRGIIHHHRNLVHPHAVHALEHEVLYDFNQVLVLHASSTVAETDGHDTSVRHTHAPCVQWTAVRPIAARTETGEGLVAQILVGINASNGVRNLAARTATRAEVAVDLQLFQRLFKAWQVRALPLRNLVRDEPECIQCGRDITVDAGHVTLEIDVFNVHQPHAIVDTCTQPAGQRGDQRADIQRPRGKGHRTATILTV